MTASLDMATGNRAHSLAVRSNDLYETPGCAVRSLLALEPLPTRIWEPACGPGSIVRELRAAGKDIVATDLVDYGLENSTAGVDFLMERQVFAGVEAVVTNPPFKLAADFVAHALHLCPHVVMLLRVAFLEGLRWHSPDEEKRGLDLGAHLARVTVFCPRLPMMHRDGWDGPKASSAMCFAWFTFRRGWASQGGQATVRWHDWRTVPTTEAEEARVPESAPLLDLMEAVAE